jgi:hypothetical protein
MERPRSHMQNLTSRHVSTLVLTNSNVVWRSGYHVRWLPRTVRYHGFVGTTRAPTSHGYHLPWVSPAMGTTHHTSAMTLGPVSAQVFEETLPNSKNPPSACVQGGGDLTKQSPHGRPGIRMAKTIQTSAPTTHPPTQFFTV